MAFIIPAAAIGGGISLVIWGAKMFFDKNDSADAKMKKFLKAVPEYTRTYIAKVEFDQGGINIQWKNTTPNKIKEETQKQITDH